MSELYVLSSVGNKPDGVTIISLYQLHLDCPNPWYYACT